MFKKFKKNKTKKQTETTIQSLCQLTTCDRHNKFIERLLELTLTPEIEKQLLWVMGEGFDLPLVIGEQFILKSKYKKLGKQFQSASYQTCLQYTLTILFDEKFAKTILKKLINRLTPFEMCELVMIGLITGTKKHLMSKYENCFTGVECIDYMLEYRMCKTRNDAETIGKMWGKAKCVKHVTDGHSFRDYEYYYQFDENIVKQKSSESRKQLKIKLEESKTNNNKNIDIIKNIDINKKNKNENFVDPYSYDDVQREFDFDIDIGDSKDSSDDLKKKYKKNKYRYNNSESNEEFQQYGSHTTRNNGLKIVNNRHSKKRSISVGSMLFNKN